MTHSYLSRRIGVFQALAFLLYAATVAHGTALEVKGRGLQTFYVDTTAGRNQVSIFSESTLEDFTVVCNTVNGQWTFDPGNVESISGKWSLNVSDLRTGISLRDRDVQKPEWLDAAKYPQIVIAVSHAEQAKTVGNNSASMVLVGTCSIHGVTRDVRIPCTVTYLQQSPETQKRVKGDLERIRAEFEIKLSDYKVTGPPGVEAIGLKVSDTLPIKVSVFGSTEKPPAPLKVDRPGVATQPAGAAPASRPSAGGSETPGILQAPARPK